MRQIHEKTVPEEFRHIIEHLENWVVQRQVMDNAKQACRASLSDHLNRQLSDFARLQDIEIDKIEMRFVKNSLMFQHCGLARPCVKTELHLVLDETAEDENGTYWTRQSLGMFYYTSFLDGKRRDEFSDLQLYPAESEAAENVRWAKVPPPRSS